MQVGDFIYLNRYHSTNCGKDYPENSISILVVTAVPDRDDELRIRFARHTESNYSYIPVCKVSLVPEDDINRAKKLFDAAVESCDNAVL